MNRRVWVVALAVAVACGTAFAREKKEGAKGGGKMETVAGTFVSAAVEGETCTWKITAEDGTEKALPMATNVVVMYMEKGEQKRAMQIRVAGKKAPEAKGNRLVATGTLTGATAAGRGVTVTVKVEDKDVEFMLPKKVTLMVRGDKALGIAPASGGGKKKKDAAPAEQ